MTPALWIEEYRTPDGTLVGWRLLTGSGDVYLVFADQESMPGVRVGKRFIDHDRTLRSRDVFVGGDVDALLEQLAAARAECDALRTRIRASAAPIPTERLATAPTAAQEGP